MIPTFAIFILDFRLSSLQKRPDLMPTKQTQQAHIASAKRDKMTSETIQSRTNMALWTLLFGNFVIGTGVLLPAGLLNQLVAELDVSAATAGLMLLASGIVVGIGAPLLAGLTTRIDRRALLVAAMMIYALGHLASAFAPSFWPLLIIRILMVGAAGIFSPQAAAAVSLMLPVERRPSAIAFIFIGWSVASVVGIPLGTILGAWIGWREVYAIMVALSVLAALAVWLTVPKGLYGVPLSLASWRKVATSPALITVLAVTLLSFSGQFVVFGYLGAILKQVNNATPSQVSLAFFTAGAAGLIGNTLASRLVKSTAVSTVVAAALFSICIGYLTFTLMLGNYAGSVAGFALWGFGTFAANSLQQSRLVQLAPVLASATVALNTSVVYLGQAIGSGIGGAIIKNGASITMPMIGVTLVTVAFATSLFATRLKV
jgi:MFS transporter, DHA1 family, inner membrane transport protein